jgi:hypothetical protein
MIRLSICIPFAAGIALSGCGGSSSGGGISFAERARDVTNAESPALTETEIQLGARSLLFDIAEDDRRNVGTSLRLHRQTDSGEILEPLYRTCDDGVDSCRYGDIDVSSRDVLDLLRAAEGESVELQPVLTKNGITTFKIEGELPQGFDFDDIRTYGAWLEHSAFAVLQQQTGEIGTDNGPGSAIYSFVGGVGPASAPDEDATYQGLMVGSPVSGEYRGNALQGDAEVVYSMADDNLDAQFTDIKDLDRGVAHATEEIRFADVEAAAATPGAYFQQSSSSYPDRYIGAAFNGPGHEEVSGWFESDNVVGAFGAIRQ